MARETAGMPSKTAHDAVVAVALHRFAERRGKHGELITVQAATNIVRLAGRLGIRPRLAEIPAFTGEYLWEGGGDTLRGRFHPRGRGLAARWPTQRGVPQRSEHAQRCVRSSLESAVAEGTDRPLEQEPNRERQ